MFCLKFSQSVSKISQMRNFSGFEFLPEIQIINSVDICIYNKTDVHFFIREKCSLGSKPSIIIFLNLFLCKICIDLNGQFNTIVLTVYIKVRAIVQTFTKTTTTIMLLSTV